jgi:molecular chaperone GrpE (heat shock protein)
MAQVEDQPVPTDVSVSQDPSLEVPEEEVVAEPKSESSIDGLVDVPINADQADDVKFEELTAAVDRLSERLRADQDVIGRMQSRIETLQGDQVRALLGPAVTELANLHAAFAESAERDYERLGFDRVRKEFTLLADRVETAIDVLGAQSLDARVGDTFDSRSHQAVRQVPSEDPALDKTIVEVVRQGFTFDPDGRPALYARVAVYSFSAASGAQDAPEETAGEPSPQSVDVSEQSADVPESPEAALAVDDFLEVPFSPPTTRQ